ncbi:MAG: methionine--tRNA ligase [Candidatus Taylorbacteria bacterium]|nr:methionine--tRNA ligase [Candidatus Taylorbacteria bacterium]
MTDNLKKFYITTTLPYVNSNPHMGHALEFVRADVIARYKKLTGYDVFFNTGTDEHGQKIYQIAQKENRDVQEYVDFYADKFKDILKVLGISDDVNFIRTTDEHHIKSAQEFWKVCDKNGYIYKKNYEIKYCVGCELEKTDSDLVEGKCPDHPSFVLEIRNEENYFFKFSSFGEKLLKFYKDNSDFVIPNFRFNEIKAFVERGLQDFSISRLKTKMPWGIEVPNDSDHIMYVWFDALVNYVSAIGWPDDLEKFNKWQVETGGMVQYCGKDNLRQQSAMWQAMLMACGLPNSKTIVIDGFVTGAGGIKMSKSIGNIVDPVEIVKEYGSINSPQAGTDALRYYVLREVSPFEDTPCTKELFKESYNANLANGLGNLVSRIMKMAVTNLEKPVEISEKSIPQEFFDLLEKFEVQKATDMIWQKVAELDKMIQAEQPFKLVKTDKEKGIEIIETLVKELFVIGEMLDPIMPETSKKIIELVKTNKVPDKPLFLRIE